MCLFLFQGGVGMSKSFSPMRHLVAAGHHMCWQSHTPWGKLNQAYLPADTILLHHYRNSTKFSERYAREWNRTVVDRTLLDLRGAELKQRAEHVLRVIGYMWLNSLLGLLVCLYNVSIKIYHIYWWIHICEHKLTKTYTAHT